MTSTKELGERIAEQRRRQRFSVQAAAKAADIARDTWAKIEAGESVHDVKRQAALDLLGLDHDGSPLTVGGDTQDDADYVSAPGERVEGGDTNDEVLRAILRMQADLERLHERMDKLDQQGS